MSRTLHLAVFTSESRVMAALNECRGLGLDIVDLRSPYPIHGLDDLMGIRRSRLPIACFVGGAIGLGLSLWFQYWVSAVDWPLNVGGKPWDSLPAFAVVSFETTILFAGLVTVFGLLLRSRLWPGRSPRYEVEGVNADRFALLVARPGGVVSEGAIEGVWERHGSVESRRILEESA